MSTSTEITKKQKIIYMKSGLPHFIDEDRVAPLEKILEEGTGHRFIKLPNTQIINTAEIEGIYTIERYAELQKIKEGYRCCEYGKWHARKEECQCKAEAWQKTQDALKKMRKQEDEKPLTAEEREKMLESNTTRNEEWALNGSTIGKGIYAIHNARGRQIRRSTIKAWEKKNGKKADLTGLAINEKA